MQVAELETDFDQATPSSRARRAVALIAFSLIAIVVAGAIYVVPTLSLGPAPASLVSPVMHRDYQVTSVDFISPTEGWLVVDFPTGDFAVIRTRDGGETWTRQLTEPADRHSVYARFFDDLSGVVAVVGDRPVLSRTFDGGETWASIPALGSTAIVLSWSFVDSLYGWMLARENPAATPKLFRTEDGGLTWLNLGNPVAGRDEAFQVQFSHFTTGWLSTVSAGPYAYRTDDFGATWTRVRLPASVPNTPLGGQYFVAVRPTTGLGALATIVYFPPFRGRTGIGGTVRGYPPLTVHAFDGGRPHTYIYSTVLDQVTTGPWASEAPPNQTELGTVDAGKSWTAVTTPATTGAVGYFDANHWWWIGSRTFEGSADGGVTWSDPRDVGVIDPVPGSLQVLDRDHAWFAGMSGSRPRLEATADGGRHWTLLALPPLEDRLTAF